MRYKVDTPGYPVYWILYAVSSTDLITGAEIARIAGLELTKFGTRK